MWSKNTSLFIKKVSYPEISIQKKIVIMDKYVKRTQRDYSILNAEYKRSFSDIIKRMGGNA
ncbi:hypothetical protein CAPN006_19450 [Capnocytophaga canimorsus]|nr:hypothetical protein CAPN006_19450 [Capnocytophaga canimorsus]